MGLLKRHWNHYESTSGINGGGDTYYYCAGKFEHFSDFDWLPSLSALGNVLALVTVGSSDTLNGVRPYWAIQISTKDDNDWKESLIINHPDIAEQLRYAITTGQCLNEPIPDDVRNEALEFCSLF